MSEQRGISRRDFAFKVIPGAAATAGLASMGIFPGVTRTVGERNPPVGEIPPSGPAQSPDAEPTHESHEATMTDNISAVVVSAAFGSMLGAVAAGKLEFGPKTVAFMSAVEGLRLGALKYAGDDTALHHDTQEFFNLTPPGSYPLLPVLITIAETASHMKVNNDKIFSSHSEDITRAIDEAGPIEEIHEGDDLEKWQAELTKRQGAVIDRLAQNAALSATFGPIGTTYTSAAMATGNQEGILKALSEFNYAQDIVTIKTKARETQRQLVFEHGKKDGEDSAIGLEKEGLEGVTTVNIDGLKSQALERSVKRMNGPDGLTNLTIALSGNTHGAGLIGDPPLIYFGLRHPELFMQATAMGLTFSELTTLAMNFYWLKRSGVDMSAVDFVPKFFNGQAKVLGKLFESFKDGDLKDVSFNGGREFAQEIHAHALGMKESGVSEEKVAQFVGIMDRIPEPALEIDVKSVVGEKLKIVRGWLDNRSTGGKLEEMVEMLERLPQNEIVGFLQGEDFAQLTNDQTGRGKDAVYRTLHELLVKEGSSSLTSMFNYLFVRSEVAGENEQATLAEIVSHMTKLPIELVDTIVPTELKGMVLGAEGLSDDAIAHLTAMAPREFQEALNDAMAFTNTESSGAREHTPHLLSHQAKEVLAVLPSQFPAVPGVARLGKMLLNTDQASQFTTDEIKKAKASVLGAIAAMTALADNVAAYIFGEQLNGALFENWLGDQYKDEKGLQSAIAISSLFMSIEAGSLSKIGNGPNITISQLNAHYNDAGDIVAQREDIPLGPSFLNPYSWVQSLVTFQGLNMYLESNMPVKK